MIFKKILNVVSSSFSGNYVSCLVIVVIFMGLGDAQVECLNSLYG